MACLSQLTLEVLLYQARKLGGTGSSISGSEVIAALGMLYFLASIKCEKMTFHGGEGQHLWHAGRGCCQEGNC